MTLTYPQFSMAFALSSTYTLTVVTSVGSWVATIAAGTYYIDESGTGDDFMTVLAAELTTADPTGTWTAVLGTQPTGLDGTVILSRTGGGNTITSITMKTGDGRTIGNDDDVISSGDFTSNTTALSVWRSPYQARYIWRPRDYLLRDEHKPRRTIARASSVTGRVIASVYSSTWHARNIVITPVRGALVYQWMADDSVFAGSVDGLATADPNVALEAFWEDYGAQFVGGTAPTVRLAPDADTPATYTGVWLTGEDWLREMDSAVTEISSDPVLYSVEFGAQTVVT